MTPLKYLVTGTGRSGTVGLAAALTNAGIPCSHERFFNGHSLEEALRLMQISGGENSFCSQHCGLPGQMDRVLAESSYMNAPYLDAPCFAGATVIHAVRNPWKVILSFLNNIQFFRGEPEHEHEQFIYSVLPHLHKIENPVDRAVYYYVHWNRLIETRGQKQRAELGSGLFAGTKRLMESLLPIQRRGSYIFHRIEDGSESLLRKLGLPEAIIERSRVQDDVNAFKEWPRELRHHVPIRKIRIEDIEGSMFANRLRRLAKRYGYKKPIPDESSLEPRDEATSASECESRYSSSPRVMESGYHGYNLVRWRLYCYALPQGEAIDLEVVTEDELNEKVVSGQIFRASRLSELRRKVDEESSKRERLLGKERPLLLESGYRCFNLVCWREEYFALHQQSLGGFYLEAASEYVLQEAASLGILCVAPSLDEVKEKVDRAVRKCPKLELGQPIRSWADA